MRELSIKESLFVAGGNQPVCYEHSYSREFWDSVAQASGMSVGFFSSPLVLVGMLAYGIVYGTVALITTAGQALFSGANVVAGGLYTGGSAVYGAVTDRVNHSE